LEYLHINFVGKFLPFQIGSILSKLKNSDYHSVYILLKEIKTKYSTSFSPTNLVFDSEISEKTERLQKGIIDGFKELQENNNPLFYVDMALRNFSLIYSECLELFKLGAIPFKFGFFEQISDIYLKSENTYLKLIPFETISVEDTIYLFKKIFSRILNLESTSCVINIKDSFVIQIRERSSLKLEKIWPTICNEVLPIIEYLPKSKIYYQLKKSF
jgi:hypothetical protein